jgi:mRNA interferase HigB
MHIVSRKKWTDYRQRHRRHDLDAAERHFNSWFSEAKQAVWKGPADIKAKYRSASVLKNGRVVFNIAGNKFRIVTKINYSTATTKGVVYIRFVGTHKEYDAIDAQEV